MRSAVRSSPSAFWASWADCHGASTPRSRQFCWCTTWTVAQTHPTSALLCRLHGPLKGGRVSKSLHGQPWPWGIGLYRTLTRSRSTQSGEEEGGNMEAASRVERDFFERTIFPCLADGWRALVRSQSGSGAGVALSTVQTHPLVRFDSQLFRTLLFRRLRVPLSLARRFCRCGRPIDAFGHHRAACARAGVLATGLRARECSCP